ncbi:MAG TPA: DUF4031 domain-containing protein [Acidimicrobiales bacterium]|nr:DUF4031 domain-containing protein [Acidimicrobiales bacterium]
MALLVDPAVWPWRGERWAHLVSDVDHDELHRFSHTLGVPYVAFQGDHYDVPAPLRAHAIELGAEPVDSRVLVRRLRAAGLRDRHAHRPWRWLVRSQPLTTTPWAALITSEPALAGPVAIATEVAGELDGAEPEVSVATRAGEVLVGLWTATRLSLAAPPLDLAGPVVVHRSSGTRGTFLEVVGPT